MTTDVVDTRDPFEPVYNPRRVEFWLAHWEELATLVQTPKSAAHIAEHLNREWTLLQGRFHACLCKELHDADTRAVDPACAHEPSGGGFRAGGDTALCIYADLRKAADTLPPNWEATHGIWSDQMLGSREIETRVRSWWQAADRTAEREPIWARTIAIRRMATALGWGLER